MLRVNPGSDFARPPRCPGRPLRADSRLDEQVKPAAAREQPRPGERSRAGIGLPVSAPVSTPPGVAAKEKIRLFCQRFTRRLDVVLDVFVRYVG